MKLITFSKLGTSGNFNDYPNMKKLIRSLKFQIDLTKRQEELESCCIPAESYRLLLSLISGGRVTGLENAVELRPRWGFKKFIDDRAKLTTVFKTDSDKVGEVFSINPSTLEGIINESANSTSELCSYSYLFRIKQPSSAKKTHLFGSKHSKDEKNFNRAMQRALPNFSEKNNNLDSYITFILPYEVSKGTSKWTVFEIDDLDEKLGFSSDFEVVKDGSEKQIKINEENKNKCRAKASTNLRIYLLLNLLDQISSNVEKRNAPLQLYNQLLNSFDIFSKNRDGKINKGLITLTPAIKHLFIDNEINDFGEIISEITREHRNNKITRNPYPDEKLRLITDLKFKDPIEIKTMPIATVKTPSNDIAELERNEKKCSGAISFFLAALSGTIISIKIDSKKTMERNLVRNTLVGPKCIIDSVQQIKSFTHNFQDNLLAIRAINKNKSTHHITVTPTKSAQLPLFDYYATKATSDMTEIAKSFFNANIIDHNINKTAYLEDPCYKPWVIFYPTQDVDYKKNWVDVITQKPPK